MTLDWWFEGLINNYCMQSSWKKNLIDRNLFTQNYLLSFPPFWGFPAFCFIIVNWKSDQFEEIAFIDQAMKNNLQINWKLVIKAWK